MIEFSIYKDEEEYKEAIHQKAKEGTWRTFCPLIKETCKGVECVLFNHTGFRGSCYLTHFLHDGGLLLERAIHKHFPKDPYEKIDKELNKLLKKKE